MLRSPYFWALLFTPVPPLNVICAAIFWIVSNLRRRVNAPEAARCLNVQLTYTLIFSLPIAAAIALAIGEQGVEDERPVIALKHIATGFPLGLISLAAILALALFNLHIFASRALGQTYREIPRFRFVKEG